MNDSTQQTVETTPETTTPTHVLADEHVTTLCVLALWAEHSRGGIVERHELDGSDFENAIGDIEDSANWRGGLGRVLNELTAWGYLDRLKAPSLSRDGRPGYRLTEAGKAAVAKVLGGGK